MSGKFIRNMRRRCSLGRSVVGLLSGGLIGRLREDSDDDNAGQEGGGGHGPRRIGNVGKVIVHAAAVAATNAEQR